MARYIDAHFAQLIADAELDSSGKEAVYWVIAHTPTADVQEVRYGKWVKPSPCSQRICSCCERTPKTIFEWLPPYCPHCGARMDGDEK